MVVSYLSTFLLINNAIDNTQSNESGKLHIKIGLIDCSKSYKIDNSRKSEIHRGTNNDHRSAKTIAILYYIKVWIRLRNLANIINMRTCHTNTVNPVRLIQTRLKELDSYT